MRVVVKGIDNFWPNYSSVYLLRGGLLQKKHVFARPSVCPDFQLSGPIMHFCDGL